MKSGNFSPLYVPAKLTFTFQDKAYDVGEHLINASGVLAFPWNQFDAMTTIAKEVTVVAEVKGSQPYTLSCKGFLFCEQTERERLLGIGFYLNESQKLTLTTVASKEGVLPPFARKFPRIPFNKKVKMMPSRAVIYLLKDDESFNIICDTDNMSPTGVQVFSDDGRAASLIPGRATIVELMPRGPNHHTISFESTVRRIIRTYQPDTGNSIIYAGMSINAMSDESREAYANLLRQIVTALKN